MTAHLASTMAARPKWFPADFIPATLCSEFNETTISRWLRRNPAGRRFFLDRSNKAPCGGFTSNWKGSKSGAVRPRRESGFDVSSETVGGDNVPEVLPEMGKVPDWPAPRSQECVADSFGSPLEGPKPPRLGPPGPGEGKPCASIADFLTGIRRALLSENPVAAAKVIDAYAKANDRLVILGGAMGDTALDPAGVKAVAQMPSREELIASIVGCIGAPAANIAGAIGAPASNIAGILSTIEERAA